MNSGGYNNHKGPSKRYNNNHNTNNSSKYKDKYENVFVPGAASLRDELDSK